ncbi:MAG: oxygen-independent coproporphyrinogen III oxidase [Pseudomonadota bacterium]
MTAQNLSRYATRAVPRYTSYPTAPHFSDAVDGVEYARWLGDLNAAKPVSLYLHVPFCRQLCWYCGCNMKLATRQEPIAQYLDTLLEEIDLLARHLPARMQISHLHWGGGTPTALSPNQLERAMDAVSAHFEITGDAELAIESDPRTLTHEMIARIGQLGFTRASFGVQEFDPKVQAAINRVQPPEMVRASVQGLREAGVGGINFDLIYGLPHQTTETLLNTISLCADMRPDRIALFGYAHVPWMAKKQRLIDEAALPGASERLEQAQAASAALLEAGYTAIGLDHFALPSDPLTRAFTEGTLRRNFQGYTTDKADALLGVGATSIGRTPSGYVQNTTETGAWSRAVKAGSLPIARGVGLTREDRLNGHIIEQLMCFGRVDLAHAADRFGVPPGAFSALSEDLEDLQADGVILFEDNDVCMTDAGAPLVRIVASVFDAYLPKNTARHAVAI